MPGNLPAHVTLVGAGVIGRGWIRVFARHGVAVTVHDPDPAQIDRTLDWLERDLAADVTAGFVSAEARTKMLGCTRGEADLARALAVADYVQESAPEKLEVKRALFADLDRLTPAEAILASSTSALDIGEIARGLAGERRCVMAHPFNPPHLLPAVEMLGAAGTDPAALTKACAILSACGQIPVRMTRYVKGFLGNRIQAAVVREALHLLESGVADAVAIDAVIRDALALRWATIGNFGANHTNADEGITQYFGRYEPSFATLMNDLDSAPPRFDPSLLRAVGLAVEAREGVTGVDALIRRRDVMLTELRQLKHRHDQG
ncbi:3-hydroxyacyl-CoA dehydrogenase NAD-binding domain-containing protein [Dongia sedimenti]|uniref:3-hydroxyacyl-CoA dehydrogenase NAD-binding domain-containing protein n=1 Tax=Dongia sedimenti TaxID=3064282 RepID=A0ABU0YQZ5_9PROT|nr:3-hydroxyacyl-CoA dehydrogenase NAD-binding domain-containing protein [Rhodospirillaceae bacterium R-7]